MWERNNGEAHRPITVYALLNRIHRKLVKNQKYTDRPFNTRTCVIVDIFKLKNFHYISFVLYRVPCIRNFVVYKLFGSQLLLFFYRTWVPFKSIKKRKRTAVNYIILLCFDSLFYFQFWILIMKGVKSCSGLSGFSLRSHHICRDKKKSSVIAGKSGFYQPVLRRTIWIFSTDPRLKLFKEHGIHSFQNDEKLSS